MAGYGQFCPVAAAAEVLAERWTPLVIRELALVGSHRFNDIRRGVPLMSSSLLSKRLRQLERAGIVERRPRADGLGSEYHLTPAGVELGPVVEQMGVWGERWLRPPVSEENADPGVLMWWVRTTVRCEALPAGRTVIHFRFHGAPEKKCYYWLVLPEADVCLTDPGFGVDVTVSSDPTTLARVWMGDVGLAAALRRRDIRLEGPEHLVRTFPTWFGLHPLAQIKRPRRSAATRHP